MSVGAGFLPVVYLVAYAFVGRSNTRPVPLALTRKLERGILANALLVHSPVVGGPGARVAHPVAQII